MEALERYVRAHSEPEDALLQELDRETHLRTVAPRMVSGHIQGRLLELLVRMLRPQRVLEIGDLHGLLGPLDGRRAGRGARYQQ